MPSAIADIESGGGDNINFSSDEEDNKAVTGKVNVQPSVVESLKKAVYVRITF